MPRHFKKIELPGRSSAEIYEKASADIERIIGKLTIGKIHLNKDDPNQKIQLKASMVEAELRCVDGALEFDAKLGLMAVPFKSKIDEILENWVQKTFNFS